MRVSGVELDDRIRGAKQRLKGLRGSAQETLATRTLAELLAMRDFYRAMVHARFTLDRPEQTSLAVALRYTRDAPRPRRELRAQIADARRVKVEVHWPYFEAAR